GWLTLFTGRLSFAWLLLTSWTLAASSCRLLFALFFALVLAATAAAITRAIATRAARRVARVTHIRTLAHFWLLGLNAAGVKTHQV
ncbi:hypothetical protein NYY91_18900, partial [Acinetobacter baumannii]|nr:hypothetical protein [Acinetobacter baumannii]